MLCSANMTANILKEKTNKQLVNVGDMPRDNFFFLVNPPDHTLHPQSCFSLCLRAHKMLSLACAWTGKMGNSFFAPITDKEAMPSVNSCAPPESLNVS